MGEGAPNSIFERESFDHIIPSGTNFDCVNADVLLNRIQVKDKEMVLPEGTTYKNILNFSNICIKRRKGNW
uniref:hypothetical protein n=1 Tax=Mariniflexile sp. TaxID=1979402 RepID=UPI004048D768